jgi:hypothetical protein
MLAEQKMKMLASLFVLLFFIWANWGSSVRNALYGKPDGRIFKVKMKDEADFFCKNNFSEKNGWDNQFHWDCKFKNKPFKFFFFTIKPSSLI